MDYLQLIVVPGKGRIANSTSHRRLQHRYSQKYVSGTEVPKNPISFTFQISKGYLSQLEQLSPSPRAYSLRPYVNTEKLSGLQFNSNASSLFYGRANICYSYVKNK
jgi:hypothetical protein